MSGQSLGLIETVGLAAAIEAADAAMKSANVQLVGYELTKGDGLVTVKFEGEVGSINAAVAAGVAAANRVSKVFSHRVIARTAEYIDRIIYSADTVGLVPVEPEETPPVASLDIPVITQEESDTGLSCVDSQPFTESKQPELTAIMEMESVALVVEQPRVPRSGNSKRR